MTVVESGGERIYGMKKFFNHTKRPEPEWDANDDFQYEWDEEDSLEEGYSEEEAPIKDSDSEGTFDDLESDADGSVREEEEPMPEGSSLELYGEEVYAEEPYGEESCAEEAYVDETYAEEAYSEEIYAEEAYSEESYTEEPYGEESYAEEPYGEESYTYTEGYAVNGAEASQDAAYCGEEDFDFTGEVTYSEADYAGTLGAERGDAYDIEDFDDVEYQDMTPDYGTFEQKSTPGTARSVPSGRKKKKKKNDSSVLDIVISLSGVAVLLLALFVGWMFLTNRTQEKQVSGFASVGLELENIHLIGEQGLLAVADATIAKIQAAGALEDANNQPEESMEPDDPAEGYEEIDISRQVEVSLNMTSIQKDLKIKFINKKTGKLIPNVPFAVKIQNPNGKTSVWSDDDMDGIIYKKDIEGGSYTVSMEELTDEKYSKYTIFASPKTVEVKKNITYSKVDVGDEVKTESEIDASKEDTKKNETTNEGSLTDTVAWVESKVISSVYNEIAKINVPDPLTLLDKTNTKTFSQLAITNSGLITPQEATIKVGEELQLKAEARITTDNANETIRDVVLQNVTWKTLQPDYLSVDGNGKVTGLKACDSSVKSAVVMFEAEVSYTVETIVEKPSEPESEEPSSEEPSSSEPSSEEPSSSEPSSEEPSSAEPSSTEPSSGETESVAPGGSEAQPSASDASGASADPTVQQVNPAPDNTEVVTRQVTEKISGSCAIVVTASLTKGTVKLDQGEVILAPNGNKELVAKVEGFAEGKTLEYQLSCDKPELFQSASVDNQGKISMTAKETEGTVAMTLTVNYRKEDGGSDETKATFSFTVRISNGMKLSLEYETLNLYAEVPLVIKARVEGAGTAVPKLTASSSNETAIGVALDSAQAQGDGKYLIPVVLDVKAAASNVTITVKVEPSDAAAKEIKAACVVNVLVNPKKDKNTKLVDSEGEPVYVFENNEYREAVYADYYTFDKFFAKGAAKYTGWQTIDGKVYYFTAEGKKVTGEQVIQGAKYMFASDGSLVVGNGVVGIDVSKWNGTIDWNAVKNSGVNYVIIRCGYRGSTQGSLVVDPKFTQNIKGATAAGLKVGVYFFTQAIDEREAVEEASMVLEQIKNYKISYPVFLDVEASGGRADSISKEQRTAVCKAFCKTIQNGGYTAGIYANKNWLETKLDPSQLAGYKIWLAQYAASPTYTGRYELWQYRKNGKVSGISGDVDMNISYLGY